MDLREILGKRALDEARLLEIIEEVTADSIYDHTHVIEVDLDLQAWTLREFREALTHVEAGIT